MDTGRGGHVSYKFPEVNLDSLLEMVERSPHGNLEIFKRDYEKIAVYLKVPLSKYQHSSLHTLLQFYDPPLRCLYLPRLSVGAKFGRVFMYSRNSHQASSSFPCVYGGT